MSILLRIRRAAAFLVLPSAGSACGVDDKIGELFRSDSPYEEYLHTLRNAGLDSTGLGKDWVTAGELALARPVVATLPFRETGYFAPTDPGAVVYRFELRHGRRLAIDISWETGPSGRLFVDLFRVREGEPLDRVASLAADSSPWSTTSAATGPISSASRPSCCGAGAGR